MIKGISRYADCSSASDDWLAFANAMAASVVNNILSEPYVFEEWSHYQGSGNQTSKGTGSKCWIMEPPLERFGCSSRPKCTRHSVIYFPSKVFLSSLPICKNNLSGSVLALSLATIQFHIPT